MSAAPQEPAAGTGRVERLLIAPDASVPMASGGTIGVGDEVAPT